MPLKNISPGAYFRNFTVTNSVVRWITKSLCNLPLRVKLAYWHSWYFFWGVVPVYLTSFPIFRPSNIRSFSLPFKILLECDQNALSLILSMFCTKINLIILYDRIWVWQGRINDDNIFVVIILLYFISANYYFVTL